MRHIAVQQEGEKSIIVDDVLKYEAIEPMEQSVLDWFGNRTSRIVLIFMECSGANLMLSTLKSHFSQLDDFYFIGANCISENDYAVEGM